MYRSNLLAVKLGQYGAITAIVIGLLATIVQIYFDYQDERRNKDALIQQIIDVSAPTAVQAAFRLDRTLAYQVADGLLTYDFVEKVEIKDDLDRLDMSLERVAGDRKLRILEGIFAPGIKQRELDLVFQNQIIGKISISYSNRTILYPFFVRSMSRLFFGVLSSLIIFAALSLVYSRLITQPVVALSKALRRLNISRPKPIDIDLSPENKNNELGLLVDDLNAVINAFQKALDDAVSSRQSFVRSELRFEDFANAASDWFWETDRNGKVVYISEGIEKKTGASPELFVGKTNMEIHEEIAQQLGPDISTGLPLLHEAVNARVPFRDIPGTIYSPKGVLNVESSGTPFFDDKSVFQGFRAITSDRTDIVNANRENLQLIETLAHGEKLRAVGELTGGVAHDFNNLLAALLGNLEVLHENIQNPEFDESDEILAECIQAVERGSALTHRLLAYARKQPLQPAVMSPYEMLNNVESLLRRTLPGTIELQIIFGGGVWNFEADPQQLETVLLNLVINARDAMPNGGHLTIEVFNTYLDADYAESRGDVEVGQYVCFAVTDDGEGISDKIMPMIFDPFFTTKPAGAGSGLGLAMSYGFAKQSGGHIAAYSETGEGTTFKLYLPRTTEAKVMNTDVAALKPIEPPQPHDTVLVIEDDEAVRNALVHHLKDAGYLVFQARDYIDGLSIAKSLPRGSLCIIDVILPGGPNGKKLADEIYKLVQDVSIIYMSGYTENAIVHQGKLDANVVLLQKPFTRDRLIRSVAQTFESKRENQSD